MAALFNWLSSSKAPRQSDCIPQEIELKRWATSEWIEYQAWLFRHAFISLHDWKMLWFEAQDWQDKPFFSLVTPIYNTPLKVLFECIYSVRTQAYPYWELCLVDDGSSHKTTLALLDALANEDKRLRVLHLPENQGICAATNAGLAMARGDYVGFLDHDDRLAPNALHAMAKSIRQQPDTQVLYSDRDMLSPRNTRFMHLFKPDWSPETLLSGNYLFHLVVYRRDLLKQLGGVRGEFEGSQDYDLILRAADTQAKVLHLPQVLYHWRQHEQSVSLDHNAKAYAYEAGIRAVEESLQRCGLQGEVEENPNLWRGNYRVKLKNPKQPAQIIRWSKNIDFHHMQPDSDMVILGENVAAMDDDSLLEMQRWLQVDGVGLVTGKLLDKTEIVHAGLVQRPHAEPLALYAGHPETTSGYMAATAIVRNVSSVHPSCCAISLKLWQQLGGLNPDYQSGYALLDFSLRALQAGYRIVYTPFARFQTQSPYFSKDFWPSQEQQRFTNTWADWLAQGDPYYSHWLTLEMNDMGLAL